MKPVALAAVVVAIVVTAAAVSSSRAAMTIGVTPSDARAAVERAVADYAEALYDVRPDLIERSVHRELTKRGFFRNGAGEWQEDIMTYDDLHALAECAVSSAVAVWSKTSTTRTCQGDCSAFTPPSTFHSPGASTTYSSQGTTAAGRSYRCCGRFRRSEVSRGKDLCRSMV